MEDARLLILAMLDAVRDIDAYEERREASRRRSIAGMVKLRSAPAPANFQGQRLRQDSTPPPAA